MCVVRNRKTNAHSTTRDSTHTSILKSNSKSVVATKNSTITTTPIGLSNNNCNHLKKSNNTPVNLNLSSKAPKGTNQLECNISQTPNNYIKSYQAVNKPHENIKEEITQGTDSIHLFRSIKKKDLSDSQKLDGLLECTQMTEKIGIINDGNSKRQKKNEQTSGVSDEDDENYEIIQDATVLNEDDTLYGIEKIMPEFHL